ncbi:chemotaxis-specific protein-glutamate methyltransferase CheB [Aquabacter sp. CN5-332]|uniref:chemotaxis-specific protein-glutamate methyltransferase CheB n=1 Tax=Aquabacter sp. CN5-332 TaxID=3156608 RepID=UPI0032B3FEF9
MSEAAKIRVLVVEDSPSQREILSWVIRTSSDLVVAGEAQNGAEALEQVQALAPDIVLMDCHMPVMDGIEATREIMRKCPVPIVMTSVSFYARDLHPGLEALREGALAIVPKPLDPDDPGFDAVVEELRLSLRLMSDVAVVRRSPPRAPMRERAARPLTQKTSMIAIGASTGGPPVILSILRHIATDLKVPVLVVQHMAPNFTAGFASWLARGANLPVEMAAADVLAKPGHVYLGPEDRHLGIDRQGRLVLDDGAPENGFRPSVSHLFRTLGDAYGPAGLAVLLTGMGEDGAEGLAHVARCGGVTVAQDKESSVVFGMPAAAIRRGAAKHVLDPAEIARFICAQLARKSLSS